MPVWIPAPGSREDAGCFHSLELVARAVIEDPGIEPVLPCEFMFMFCARAGRRRTIYAYKHVDSRAYLFIDPAGRTYAWHDTGADQGEGTYHRLALGPAVQRLELALFRIPRPLEQYCDTCRDLIATRSLLDPTFVVDPPMPEPRYPSPPAEPGTAARGKRRAERRRECGLC